MQVEEKRPCGGRVCCHLAIGTDRLSQVGGDEVLGVGGKGFMIATKRL